MNNEAYNQVEFQVYNQVENQVWDEVNSKVRGLVVNQLKLSNEL